MNHFNDQKRYRSLEIPEKEHDPAKNVQVSGYINEGNPNTQEATSEANIADDKQSAQVVKQAIKDDQGLAAVAHEIRVTVKDGVVTLDGKVSTEQQINLATNTATAVGAVGEVNNQDLHLKKAEDNLSDPLRKKF